MVIRYFLSTEGHFECLIFIMEPWRLTQHHESLPSSHDDTSCKYRVMEAHIVSMRLSRCTGEALPGTLELILRRVGSLKSPEVLARASSSTHSCRRLTLKTWRVTMELAMPTLDLKTPLSFGDSQQSYKDCTGVLIIILETWRLSPGSKEPWSDGDSLYRHGG
jgi:hypothetical protein